MTLDNHDMSANVSDRRDTENRPQDARWDVAAAKRWGEHRAQKVAAPLPKTNPLKPHPMPTRGAALSGPFHEAFNRVIGHEGGYSNHPHDRGGETKFGISSRSYPDLDIKNLTLNQARSIYHSDYWYAAGCYMLPAGLAYAVFDAAVNAGVGRATRWLQEAVGTAPDGVIGPATRAAISLSMRNPLNVLETLNAIRLKHYMDLSQQQTDTFGLGWSRRVLQVHTTALALSGETA